MNKHINFEDNIFVLNLRIRMIQDLLILDTDPGLFLHKTMDDLDFINSCLNVLLSNLRENNRLIERSEEFHNLAETDLQFCEALKEMDRSGKNISVIKYPELQKQLNVLLTASQDRLNSIKDLIGEAKQLTMEPVVGYDELNELLSS